MNLCRCKICYSDSYHTIGCKWYKNIVKPSEYIMKATYCILHKSIICDCAGEDIYAECDLCQGEVYHLPHCNLYEPCCGPEHKSKCEYRYKNLIILKKN